MYIKTLQNSFERDGFIHIKKLLDKQTADQLRLEIENLSGITSANFSSHDVGHRLFRKPVHKLWNSPDGVSKNQKFWPLIFNEDLLKNVKYLLGDKISYLQHSDVHAGFSAAEWHRDSVNREYGKGPDWINSDSPYKILRVGIYLQSYEESGFKLGFIKGSHRFESRITNIEGKLMNKYGIVSKICSGMRTLCLGQEMLTAKSTWIAPEKGDCFIFDPRVLHSGSYIHGPKYSIFLGFGVENEHYYNHASYYRKIRKDLGYQDLNPDLLSKLREASLYPHNIPYRNTIQDLLPF